MKKHCFIGRPHRPNHQRRRPFTEKSLTRRRTERTRTGGDRPWWRRRQPWSWTWQALYGRGLGRAARRPSLRLTIRCPAAFRGGRGGLALRRATRLTNWGLWSDSGASDRSCLLAFCGKRVSDLNGVTPTRDPQRRARLVEIIFRLLGGVGGGGGVQLRRSVTSFTEAAAGRRLCNTMRLNSKVELDVTSLRVAKISTALQTPTSLKKLKPGNLAMWAKGCPSTSCFTYGLLVPVRGDCRSCALLSCLMCWWLQKRSHRWSRNKMCRLRDCSLASTLAPHATPMATGLGKLSPRMSRSRFW